MLKPLRCSLPVIVLIATVALPSRAVRIACIGDCDDDATVTIDEIITGVSIAEDVDGVIACPAMDPSGDATVTIDELVQAVHSALEGCPAAEVIVEHAQGSTRTIVPLDVSVRVRRGDVAEVQADFSFEPQAPVKDRGDGKPDCAVDAHAGALVGEFVFLPSGCAPDVDCTGVHAEIHGLAGPFPETLRLYTCNVGYRKDPGGYPNCYPSVPCVAARARDGAGAAVGTVCIDGGVRFEDYPSNAVTFDFSVEPQHPVVGDRVLLTVRSTGVGGEPQYTLSGAQPALEGDTSPRYLSPITYDLTAAAAGRALLVMSVSYEVQHGCGDYFYFVFEYVSSDPFEVEIAEPAAKAM